MSSIVLALISGLVTGCIFNFPLFSILSWFSLIPLFSALHNSKTAHGVSVCGFVFGISFHAASVFWIGNVSVIGLCALGLYLSLYSVALGLICRGRMESTCAVVGIPCVWVVLEFFKENVWCGFGWNNLAYAQYHNLYLIQIADIFGAKAISFMIVAVNVFLWRLLVRKKREAWSAVFIVTLVFGAFLYSSYRLATLSAQDHVIVSVVQPNVAERMKNNAATEAYVIDRLASLAHAAEKGSLVVFPEAAWPAVSREDDLASISSFVKTLSRPSLMGAVTFDAGNFYNSALYFDPQGGLVAKYHKIRLVPFGEYVPLRKYLSFIEVLNSLGDLSRGKEYTVFKYGGKKFSTLICFEDVFPGFVSRFARDCDFLVNITNDEWFGGQPQARQHLGILVLRAVECRRSMARCANTGVSGWISYKGEISALTKDSRDVFFEECKTYDLALNSTNSLYNKWGEFFPFVAAVIALWWCVSAAGKKYFKKKDRRQ